MRRGLGKMQSAILTALGDRQGGGIIEVQHYYRAQLRDGVHDLRRMSREMGGENPRGFIDERWQASFSRSVAGLVTRGLIKSLWLVPVISVDPGFPWPTHNLADGLYVDWLSRQRRFAKLIDG